jgi:hypothetical protein
MNSSFLLISYCILAILITVSNKYILLTFIPYGYNANFFILFIQSVISIVLLRIAKFYSYLRYCEFNFIYLKSWIPIVALLILSIYSNGRSMLLLPISLFNILKNFGSLLIIIGDVTCFGKVMGSSTVLSFLLVILSNFYSIYNDIFLSSRPQNLEGFAWAIINCMSCALYALYVKYHRRVHIGVTNIEYVYYNTLLTTPILLALSLNFEGIHRIYSIIQFNYSNNNLYWFVLTLLLSSVLTLLIAVTIASIYINCSITTYTIIGSLNKFIMTFASVLIFSDEKELYELHGNAIFGTVLSLLTGIYLILYA